MKPPNPARTLTGDRPTRSHCKPPKFPRGGASPRLGLKSPPTRAPRPRGRPGPNPARSPRAHSANRSSSSSCAPSSHASRPSMVVRGPAPPRSRRGAAASLGAQPRRDCGELIPAGSAPRAQRRARAARPQSLRGPRAAPQRRACRPLSAGTRWSPPRTHPDPTQPPQTRAHTAAVTVPAAFPTAPSSGHQGCPTPHGVGGSLRGVSGEALWARPVGWGHRVEQVRSPPRPQALITSKQCRPHLGPGGLHPPPPPHSQSFCLGLGDS